MVHGVTQCVNEVSEIFFASDTQVVKHETGPQIPG